MDDKIKEALDNIRAVMVELKDKCTTYGNSSFSRKVMDAINATNSVIDDLENPADDSATITMRNTQTSENSEKQAI